MTVEEAIRTAIGRVKDLFGGTEHRLEEMELKDTGDFEITVSYRVPDEPRLLTVEGGGQEPLLGRPRSIIGVDASRLYKLVTVSKTGEVKSVRMRQIVLG